MGLFSTETCPVEALKIYSLPLLEPASWLALNSAENPGPIKVPRVVLQIQHGRPLAVAAIKAKWAIEGDISHKVTLESKCNSRGF